MTFTQEQLIKLLLLQTRSVEEAKVAYQWLTAGDREEPIELGSDEPLEPFSEEEYYRDSYPFNIKLRECWQDLSTRSINLMEALGIETLGELCGWPKHQIQRQKGLGKKSYLELTDLLRKHHLQWEMWTSPSYKAAYPPKL